MATRCHLGKPMNAVQYVILDVFLYEESNYAYIVALRGSSKSKKESKYQDSTQSSTTTKPGHQWESDNFTSR